MALVVVAVARIVATYGVFNQTFDESAHVAAGMEWLDSGRYDYETRHPPLARVAVALGPYLAGVRSHGLPFMWDEGNAILHDGGAYLRNLALARAGVLPFFALAAVLVWLWTRRLAGERTALVAVALFTLLPPVLAHAAVATTDMALTALLLGATYAFARWIERPSIGRSALLGMAAALAVLTKFSALLFLPAGAVAALAARLTARSAPNDHPAPAPTLAQIRTGVLVAGWAAVLVVWAAYRFSVDLGGPVPLPFPEFTDGVRMVVAQNAGGQYTYLLGEAGAGGWWYFFPVALAVKTPLPFLLLAAAGGVEAARRWRRRAGNWQAVVPLACAMAIVAVSTTSRINIGLRHVLPVYPLLAITAALGAAALWRHRSGRPLVAAGAVWLAAGSARAHPDYLSYFNELAPHPDRVLVNGDLDWGQDLLRLTDTLRARHIGSVSLAYFGSADPRQFGIGGLHCMGPAERPSGWVAASEYLVKGVNPKRSYAWLSAYRPVARVGSSILLYELPAGSAPAGAHPPAPPLRCFGS